MSMLHVGIDPAKTKCVARVVDQSGQSRGQTIAFKPDRPGVEGLIARVQKIDPEAKSHFFIESSGINWYAPAALLQEQGHPVSFINPSCTKAQRNISSRYAKSDAKDAEAIARAPFNMGDRALHPADIPEGPRLNLRLLCRHRHMLQGDATAIKMRVIAWLGLSLPGLTQIIGTDLSALDRELIVRYPVAAKLLRSGKKRLRDLLERVDEDALDDADIEALFDMARKAYSPRDFDDKLMARQFKLEFQRLALIEKQIKELDKEIANLLPECDPEGFARTIPGFGAVVAPIMVAEAGTDVSRFASAPKFAGWTGVVGRAAGSNGKQKDGLPMTKAGRSIVKWALYMAANAAVMHDPETRAFYDRLRAKDKHHNAALGAVANKLARIYWAVMTEQRPFKQRSPADPDDAQKGLDAT